MRPRLWLNAMLLTVAIIGYPTVMHWLLTHPQWPALTLSVGLAPLLILPMAWFNTGHPVAGVLALAFSGLGVALFWHTLLPRQDWIYLMQNVGMQVLMAWIFGRTLLPRQEALISLLARRIHGPEFTPAIAAYTRQATWAWLAFFVVMALMSLILFFTAPIEVWSFFANVLYLPLLALMFVLEYAARRYCLRGVQQPSFIKGVSLYWDKQSPADGQP